MPDMLKSWSIAPLKCTSWVALATSEGAQTLETQVVTVELLARTAHVCAVPVVSNRATEVDKYVRAAMKEPCNTFREDESCR